MVVALVSAKKGGVYIFYTRFGPATARSNHAASVSLPTLGPAANPMSGTAASVSCRVSERTARLIGKQSLAKTQNNSGHPGWGILVGGETLL